MSAMSTTVMSSKGQVVIPEDVREQLGLHSGTRFVVVGDKDVVILKTIQPPSFQDFSALLAKSRAQARRAGLTRADVGAAVERVRRRNRR